MRLSGISGAFATLLVALLPVVCACHNKGEAGSPGETSRPESPAEGSAIVCGSVIDLKSGAPAAGVSVVGPGGKTTRTDGQGRFELRGLALGATGEVRARADDGREAVNVLLPLGHERREIVLHLEAR